MRASANKFTVRMSGVKQKGVQNCTVVAMSHLGTPFLLFEVFLRQINEKIYHTALTSRIRPLALSIILQKQRHTTSQASLD